MYIDQSHHQLAFYACNGCLDVSGMNILRQHTTTYKDINITFAIIGESHFVTLRCEGNDFFELLSCLRLEQEPSVWISHHKEYPLCLQRELFDGRTYHCEITITDMNETLCPEIEDSKDNRAMTLMSYEFDVKDEVTPSAKTYCMFQEEEQRLYWETHHSYPNENRMVITKSYVTAV